MDPKSIVILAFQLSIVCTVLGFGLHVEQARGLVARRQAQSAEAHVGLDVDLREGH